MTAETLRVLLLEDVANDAELAMAELERAGLTFTARRVATRDAFLESLRGWVPDLILADYSLPSFDGMTALRLARRELPESPFIFVSGAIGEERAIEGLRDGATDYVLKHRLAKLGPAVTRALQEARERGARRKAEVALRRSYEEIAILKARLEEENVYLREELKAEHGFGDIIGQTPVLRRLLKAVEQVAPTDASVLISGETGTGKELVARAVHERSRRRLRPLIKVNCAALSPTLIESELFGHERGAFTGAVMRKAGRFELANGGTLFLDEIGELPLELQPKLLRVLQERQLERVGGTHTLEVDVRVIAATNRDPEQAVAAERLRSDLYYRLNVFPLQVPPLRERKEDIPLLVQHLAKKLIQKLGRSVDKIPQRTMAALVAYDWPGNVRELENVIERAVILSSGPTLTLGAWRPPADRPAEAEPFRPLRDVERRHILNALTAVTWRVSGKGGAAELLGLKPTTLEARMKRLGITRPR